MKILPLVMTVSVMLLSLKAWAQVTDGEGITYKTVTIGQQLWMAENLNVSRFRNGDIIPEVKTEDEWRKAISSNQAAWCYYDNDPANRAKYGKLYNWFAVNDPRGLAPKGWHVATGEEWLGLMEYLGGEKSAGAKMKFTSGWKDDKGRDGNGSNSSGFAGLPGGERSSRFYGLENNGMWWSSTENPPIYAWSASVYYHSDELSIYYYNTANGKSVRCIKD